MTAPRTTWSGVRRWASMSDCNSSTSSADDLRSGAHRSLGRVASMPRRAPRGTAPSGRWPTRRRESVRQSGPPTSATAVGTAAISAAPVSARRRCGSSSSVNADVALDSAFDDVAEEVDPDTLVPQPGQGTVDALGSPATSHTIHPSCSSTLARRMLGSTSWSRASGR